MQVVSFRNGHVKLGGRKAGTRNRSTSVRECLERLNLDPVEEVVKIAQSDASSNELRARIWLCLAEYCSPKLRAVDQVLTTPDGSGLRIEIVRIQSTQPRLPQPNGRIIEAPPAAGEKPN